MGYYKMAQTLILMEDEMGAIDNFTKVTELEPDFVHAYLGLARIYEKRGNYDKTIEFGLKILEIQPDDIMTLYYLSKSYIEKGMYDKAQEYATQEMKDNSEYHKVITQLADKLLEKKQIERAVKYYLEAVELNPDSAYLNGVLGWIQAASPDESVRNPQRAVKFAEKACQITEYKNASELDTLAVAYAAVGKFDKATSTSEDAVEIAHANGESELAKRIEDRVELYKMDKVYIDKSLE